ncbi:unnamed protein product [Trichobilharzia szidati]|nr:unnamed protein product [Trichobilharzia szidati]
MSSSWNETGWWADQEESELSYAHEKLDRILQMLVEDPSRITKYKDDVASRRDPSEKEKYRSPFYKVSPTDIKRKKRREPSDEEETYKESFVIKVFERSVDFGQFSENAALYPMARAWIRNLNQGDSSSWNDVPSMDDDQENNDQLPDCHYALPKPSDGFTDNDIRIPPPLPSEGQPFLINIEEMSPEGLLEQHIVRWREIRRKWKAACRDNEERYLDSYLILKETYDKFCKDMP